MDYLKEDIDSNIYSRDKNNFFLNAILSSIRRNKS